jgi:geranylgeranyl transferase type-2 subunit beta
MTIRLDMYRRVSRAGAALGDSLDTVSEFLRRQLTPDGGFAGRDGRSDLYYTVFGLEASLALGVDLPHERVNAYLDSFEMGDALDLVHLTSLIRCRANMVESFDAGAPGGASVPARLKMSCGDARPTKRLLAHRSRDGGFNIALDAAEGSAYGSFMTLGAYQDLGLAMPDMEAVARSVSSLQMPDGGFSNEPAMAVSATPATAAAICVLHYLKRPVPEAALRWLLDRVGPHGGFMVLPLTGDLAIPDLLSTATALFAFSLVGALPEDGREKHLDYLDSLWSTQGGFRGHAGDQVVDCEYTYYGLLSLGCLAG